MLDGRWMATRTRRVPAAVGRAEGLIVEAGSVRGMRQDLDYRPSAKMEATRAGQVWI